jgi:quinol monooxygenase YgiN
MSDETSLFTRRGFCAAGAAAATIGFHRPARAADAATDQMITQVARFKLNMDNEAEALQALKDLCAAVEENEPGVLVYICHRSTKNPDELVFFEVYQDEAALKAHATTPHLAKLRTSFAKLFRPPLEVTRMDRIGGFARSS